jgi:hypothetical protein
MDARIAGFTFLFYIAAGIGQMALFGAGGTAAKLSGGAQQASALVLAVTLYRVTRDVGPRLSMLAMICRVCEGVLGPILKFLLNVPWSVTASATFFAVGSTLFCWLFLRGRLIPVPLAWLGLFASVLLVVGLPLQLAGLLTGAVRQLLWLPMAVFEIPLGFWLLIKGARVLVIA